MVPVEHTTQGGGGGREGGEGKRERENSGGTLNFLEPGILLMRMIQRLCCSAGFQFLCFEKNPKQNIVLYILT